MKVYIVGGGAAGFFSAIQIAENCPEAEVHILEAGQRFLQKVKISGGGRCNLTHACWTPKELVKHYPRGEKALLGPFHRFACGDTMDWFEQRGVPLKIEKDGRVFPQSNSSQSIVDCLMQAAEAAGVQLHLQQRVSQIKPLEEGGYFLATKGGAEYKADKLVLAAGSSAPIWAILAEMGLNIVPAVPSLFTFNSKDFRLKGLPGLSVPQAEVEVLGQKNLKARGPLLITHWGLSGPGILRLSAWGARKLFDIDYRFGLRVNWLGWERQALQEELQLLKKDWAKKQLSKTSPFSEIPNRLWRRLLYAAGIKEDKSWANLSKKELLGLEEELTACEIKIAGKSTFKDEFVTAGGVDLDQMNFKTFETKAFKGLYIAGELLNIDAITGGFNFQAAWTGGWSIGQDFLPK